MSPDADAFTGATGTTRTESVPVATDEGELFRTEVYTSVHADRDPELADALVEGHLNEVTGPTGQTHHLAVGVRFHRPSHRQFALFVPEPLRHRTFELRRELLADLADEKAPVPAYVSDFSVVLDRDRLRNVEGRGSSTSANAPVEGDGISESELASEREELEALRRELDRREQELEQARQELEQERKSFEAEQLNLERKTRELERDRATEEIEPDTQVVTEDQFISEEPRTDEPAEGDDRPGTGVDTDPGGRRATPIEVDALPGELDAERVGEAEAYVEVAGARVRASAAVSDEQLEAFELGLPRLYVQLHEAEGVAFPALTLAAFDDEALLASIGWPLDPDDDRHSAVIHRLSEEFDLDIGLYDSDHRSELAFEFRAPYERNLEWIRGRLEEREDQGSFRDAASAFRSAGFERVGNMRHNFDRDAFRELEQPSQVKLSAGVVGYWSSDEQLRYLIANRTYPVEAFRALQDEVIEAALEYGIYLSEPLRERAAEQGLVADDVDLVERQLANFAEVAVQLRDNDLDPIDEWENWDELIELAKSVGVTPDPEVLELAEASLERARDYRETGYGGRAEIDEGRESDGGAGAGHHVGVAGDGDDIVSRESESTGVTYFVPEEEMLDTFDDLADMPREDLEQLLEDPNGRLEAAQMLLEQYGAEALSSVLEAAESMAAPEVSALARFLEMNADRLEDALLEALESAGPSSTLVVTRALSKIQSDEALPDLVEVYRRAERRFNRDAFAAALARYDEKLLAETTRWIEEEGVNDRATQLLVQLAARDPALVEELDDHESEAVRETAERARSQRL